MKHGTVRALEGISKLRSAGTVSVANRKHPPTVHPTLFAPMGIGVWSYQKHYSPWRSPIIGRGFPTLVIRMRDSLIRPSVITRRPTPQERAGGEPIHQPRRRLSGGLVFPFLHDALTLSHSPHINPHLRSLLSSSLQSLPCIGKQRSSKTPICKFDRRFPLVVLGLGVGVAADPSEANIAVILIGV